MMRRFGSTFLVFIFLFAVTQFASVASASIVGFSCADDGDGAIVMNPATLTPVGDEYDLTMSGVQNWHPAHMLGDFTTDTELDPTVRIIEYITNDTTFDWTDYHITITMNKTFTISHTAVVTPTDWTWVITDPTVSGTNWVGMIDYYQDAGDPVAMGDEGAFGFKVSFLGSVAFSTAQVPTPEPTTIALLGLGAISLIRKRRA
jgi:hypothetical protein